MKAVTPYQYLTTKYKQILFFSELHAILFDRMAHRYVDENSKTLHASNIVAWQKSVL